MRQVHLRPGLLEHVHGPVPAVRRLDDHLRVLPRPGQHRPQRLRRVLDPDGLQLPAVPGHPHQHAAPPVQVHPDDQPAVICFRHRGPPVPWWRRTLCNFQHPPGAEARSFIASRESALDTSPPANRAAAISPMGRGGAQGPGPGWKVPGVDAWAGQGNRVRVADGTKEPVPGLAAADRAAHRITPGLGRNGILAPRAQSGHARPPALLTAGYTRDDLAW